MRLSASLPFGFSTEDEWFCVGGYNSLPWPLNAIQSCSGVTTSHLIRPTICIPECVGKAFDLVKDLLFHFVLDVDFTSLFLFSCPSGHLVLSYIRSLVCFFRLSSHWLDCIQQAISVHYNPRFSILFGSGQQCIFLSFSSDLARVLVFESIS